MSAPSPGDWHARTGEECLRVQDSQLSGLDNAEAQRRLRQHGPNRLPQARPKGPLRRLLLQFHNLLIYVLLAASLLTLLLGEWLDSAVIFAVGVGVVAVLALRAMGEWRAIEHQREGAGPRGPIS